MSTNRRKEPEDLLKGALRPNAPVSIVQNAKASLKNPTRPYTPAESNRSLYSSEDSTSWSSSAMHCSFQSIEASPKVILPRLGPIFQIREEAGQQVHYANPSMNSDMNFPSTFRRQSLQDSHGYLAGTNSLEAPSALPSSASVSALSTPGIGLGHSSPLHHISSPTFRDPSPLKGRNDLSRMPLKAGLAPTRLENGAEILEIASTSQYSSFHRPADDAPPPSPESDAQKTWREDVEGCLIRLDKHKGIPKDAPASHPLLQEASRLVALVDQVREQLKDNPREASKWLNTPSQSFGTLEKPLTLRRAIIDHTLILMDQDNALLLIKAASVIFRISNDYKMLHDTALKLSELLRSSPCDPTLRQERVLPAWLFAIRQVSRSVVPSKTNRLRDSAPMLLEALAKLLKPLHIMTADSRTEGPANQKELIQAGALVTMMIVVADMTMLAKAEELPEDVHLRVCSVLVLMAEILRNLSVRPEHTPRILESKVLLALQDAISVSIAHLDLLRQYESEQRKSTGKCDPEPEALVKAYESVNVKLARNYSRVMSKVTEHPAAVSTMEEDTRYAAALVRLLGLHQRYRGVLLRVAFALGNITTSSAQCRLQVGEMLPGALNTVVTVFESAVLGDLAEMDKEAGSGAKGNEEELSREASREQCVVKLLRLLANLAMYPPAGQALAEKKVVSDCIMKLLEFNTLVQEEELILNLVCLATNLCFYHKDVPNKVLEIAPDQFLPHIAPLLWQHDNPEVIVEGARLYGNYCRSEKAINYVAGSGVVPALALLLAHTEPDVLCAVAGTIINLGSHTAVRRQLLAEKAPALLVEALDLILARATGPGTPLDVNLAGVICKALYNLAVCEDNASSEPNGNASSERGGSSGPGRLLTPKQKRRLQELLQRIEDEADSLRASEQVYGKGMVGTGMMTLLDSGGDELLEVVTNLQAYSDLWE